MEVGFGLTVSSTTIDYRKLITDNESPKTYEQWMHMCSSKFVAENWLGRRGVPLRGQLEL